jgi:hypothetical protein
MKAQKLSISLQAQQCEFVEHYQVQHHYEARSYVVKAALRLLHEVQLEVDYKEAADEIDGDF